MGPSSILCGITGLYWSTLTLSDRSPARRTQRVLSLRPWLSASLGTAATRGEESAPVCLQWMITLLYGWKTTSNAFHMEPANRPTTDKTRCISEGIWTEVNRAQCGTNKACYALCSWFNNNWKGGGWRDNDKHEAQHWQKHFVREGSVVKRVEMCEWKMLWI